MAKQNLDKKVGDLSKEEIAVKIEDDTGNLEGTLTVAKITELIERERLESSYAFFYKASIMCGKSTKEALYNLVNYIDEITEVGEERRRYFQVYSNWVSTLKTVVKHV
jgi:hypothetical protein